MLIFETTQSLWMSWKFQYSTQLRVFLSTLWLRRGRPQPQLCAAVGRPRHSGAHSGCVITPWHGRDYWLCSLTQEQYQAMVRDIFAARELGMEEAPKGMAQTVVMVNLCAKSQAYTDIKQVVITLCALVPPLPSLRKRISSGRTPRPSPSASPGVVVHWTTRKNGDERTAASFLLASKPVFFTRSLFFWNIKQWGFGWWSYWIQDGMMGVEQEEKKRSSGVQKRKWATMVMVVGFWR